MSPLLTTLVGVAVLLALEASAESLLTLWSRHARAWMIVLGVALYALVGVTFALALKWSGGNLGAINALWQAANICVVTVISVVAFRKPLSRVEWLGVALAFLASICFVH